MSAAARLRDALPGAALRTHAAAVYVFLYAPIVLLVVFSFSASRFTSRWGGFTLDWYGRLFRNEALLDALGNTVRLGLTSTLLAGVLGTLAALGVDRLPRRRRALVETLFYLPVVTPDIVLGLSLLLAFALVLQIDLSLTTMTIAHVVFNTSYVMVVVLARLRGLDPRLDEAAADLGAGPWRTFFRIKLPLLWPGILGGGLLALALSLDEFTIAFFVSGPSDTTLPIRVFSMLKRSVTPELNALATLMLLASIVLALLSLFVQRRP